jgi:parvulin-like peptidyl-prolyl isomerase
MDCRMQVAAVAAVAAVVAACASTPTTRAGPLVARGDGIALTAAEVKARIDEQSPLIRPAFKQMDAKRMIVENLLKVDLLAHAAEKAGLENDPDVRYALKTVLASRYQQRFLSDPERVKHAVGDAEIARYYEEHPDEFHKPLRIHTAHIFVAADASGPGRAKKLAEARKLLQKVVAEEKENRAAFSRIAVDASDDAETRPHGGDLMFQSREQLERSQGKDFAEVAFATDDDRTASTLVETGKGFHLVHVYGRAPAVDRSLEEAKPEITRELLIAWKTKAFNDLIDQLRRETRVTVDEAALEKVMPEGAPVAAATSPAHAEASVASTRPPAAPPGAATH